MALRACTVSFKGVSGIRHSVEVEAESLYEAVVLAICRFKQDIWGETIASGTQLEVEVREPSTKHTLTVKQVEAWLGKPGTPFETGRKAKLKTMLLRDKH